jgi:hypothetical protein
MVRLDAGDGGAVSEVILGLDSEADRVGDSHQRPNNSLTVMRLDLLILCATGATAQKPICSPVLTLLPGIVLTREVILALHVHSVCLLTPKLLWDIATHCDVVVITGQLTDIEVLDFFVGLSLHLDDGVHCVQAAKVKWTSGVHLTAPKNVRYQHWR